MARRLTYWGANRCDWLVVDAVCREPVSAGVTGNLQGIVPRNRGAFGRFGQKKHRGGRGLGEDSLLLGTGNWLAETGDEQATAFALQATSALGSPRSYEPIVSIVNARIAVFVGRLDMKKRGPVAIPLA
jgi:hypothetical protein